MKKSRLFLGLALVFIAGGITSCGKTNKMKITGDYNVDLWLQEYRSKGLMENEDDYYDSYKFEGNKVTFKEDNDIIIGSIKENTMSINKDGTWILKRAYTLEFGEGESEYTKTEISGTWDFLGGVGNFKKNERIALSVQKEKETGDYEGVWEYGYENGYDIIFIITESTSKKLSLEMPQEYTYTSLNTTNGDVDYQEKSIVTTNLNVNLSK